MILVTGEFTAKADCLELAIKISLEHVKRSRLEDGCISHSVQQDIESPLRLVFFEEWRDMSALSAHFAVPESKDFVKYITELASDSPKISIFEARRINPK